MYQTQVIQLLLVIVSLCILVTDSGGYFLYDFDNGLIGGDLNCHTSATISCKFAVNTSIITWKIAQTIEDSTPLAAQCFEFSCMVNSIFSPTYNFTYDNSTGVTNVTIKTVTFEHANLEFRCDNGSQLKPFKPNVTVPPEQHLTEVRTSIMDEFIELSLNIPCIYPTNSVNITWYSKTINGTNIKQETESKRTIDPCTASSDCILANKSSQINSTLHLPRPTDDQRRKRSTGSVQERAFEVLVQHASGSFVIEAGNYSVSITEENENVVIPDASGCFSKTGCIIGVVMAILGATILFIVIIVWAILRNRKSGKICPDSPTGLKLIDKTETTATLTWMAGHNTEGENKYWLCYKQLQGEKSTLEEIEAKSTTETIKNLKPGCMYQCYVYAMTGNRKSNHSKFLDFKTFAKQLYYEITGLQPATHYEVFVYAENLFGKSKSTGVQEVSTEGLLPQPPAELIHSKNTETEVTLFWKPVIYKQKQSFYLTYTIGKDQCGEVIPFDNYEKKVEHLVFNLSPGTDYVFSLWAFFVNPNESHKPERCVVQRIKTKGLPQDPVDFHLVEDTLTETTAEFRWKPGKYRKYEQTFVISYWLKGYEESKIPVTVNDTHQMTISHSVNNLQAGQQYGFCIVAQNKIGVSNISDTLFVQTKGLPDKPRQFRLVDDLLTETTATFMWEPGEYRKYQQTFVISYCLEHDEKHTHEEKVEDTAEKHITHTVPKLKEGKQYEFQIRANNMIGVSYNGKKLLVKTKGLPEEPKHFRLVDNRLTETSATFTWVPGVYRKYTQTFVILYFARKYKKHHYQDRVEDTYESTITHTVRNLQEATQYEFIVYATNNFGDSKDTDKISVETKGKPENPSDLIATPNTPTSISISWIPGEYRTAIQHFIIKYRRVSRSSKRKWKKKTYQETLTNQEIESKQLYYEITELQPASDYEISVQASNCFGKSKKKEEVKVSTEGLLPQPPAEFVSCNITETEVTLSWKPVIYRQKQSFYLTYTSEKEQKSEMIPFDNNQKEVEYSVSNLSPGTLYEFSVWAFFGNTMERKSDRWEIQMITTKGLPDDPVDFHLVEDTLTETIAEFRWKPGKYRKYKQSFVISYWLKDDKENITLVTVNDTQQKTISYLVKNLQEGQQYVFCIVARNEIGNSNISETVFVQTKGLPQDPVDFHLVAERLTETTAEFCWKPGKYRKYKQIFVISYWLKGDEEKITNKSVYDTHQNTLSYLVKNLQPGNEYGFCIVAQNEIGKSSISESVFVQTKGLPDEPRNFRLVDDLLTETTATFIWEPGEYRKYQQTFVISYCLQHDENHTHKEEVADEIENYCTHTVSGLKEGKQYEFEMWSKNRIGVSNRCTKLLIETKGKPENPSDLIASPNTPTSVLIRWKPGQYRRDIQHFVISYRMASGSSEIKWETLSYDENRKAASEVVHIQTVSTHDEVMETETA